MFEKLPYEVVGNDVRCEGRRVLTCGDSDSAAMHASALNTGWLKGVSDATEAARDAISAHWTSALTANAATHEVSNAS